MAERLLEGGGKRLLEDANTRLLEDEIISADHRREIKYSTVTTF